MNITIIGTGYVGLVTATCLADLGHRVVGVNRDPKKSAGLNDGRVPMYEPGLAPILRRALRRGDIRFTTNFSDALQSADVVFIAVGTPAKDNGSADLSQVRTVARQIGRHLRRYTVIANKSTVPVGTAQEVTRIIRRTYRGKFDVVSCPEFLREGSAVRDFMQPDRIVIGSSSDRATRLMLSVFSKLGGTKLVTAVETAEMIKYASNAFLATKISFINEIANVCDLVGANVEDVARGMGLDPRIGQAFLKAGIGYGGSCFPKDVHALNTIAGTKGYNFRLLKSVIEVNNRQRAMLVQKIQRVLKRISGRRIAVLGLAFKGNTDDIRESGAIDIIRLLQKSGAKITTYDPAATANAKSVLNGSISYARNPIEAVRGADAVVIATEWPAFRRLPWRRIRSLVRRPVIFDGKNLLDRAAIESSGFKYFAVGK